MENDQLISTEDFCLHYHAEHAFVESLSDAGLIEITLVQERQFLHPSQLPELEKFCRLHYDLEINIEGLEAIAHLLHQMQDLRREMQLLRQRLKLHEDV